ncbi:carbohydrate esterase family 16 protein [Mycena metata]|uniref:Carbohydrate esterase family 16 protein n=1 Tax=Mycena metata TaxID=1033252 RepID=A0AAD7NEL8_9AGAR|nr:carbohydrate esterase family 16 protein [Mycena metata]
MFSLRSSTVLALLCATSSAVVLTRAADAVQLAVSPQCGPLDGSAPADVNVGLGPLSSYKTIVAFGDSFTGGSTNGPTWVQALANSTGATLIQHAAPGAVVDVNQWPQVSTIQSDASVDFIHQVETFLAYGQPIPDPATTLYIVFFGIGDYEQAAAAETNMNQIAGVQVWTSLELASATSFAENVLVVDNYGLGKTSPMGDAYKQYVFTAVGTSRRQGDFKNVGFASFNGIWEGILYGSPGAAAFGYTNTGVCVQNGQTCSDPAHTLYWTPGTPTAATHSIMADYVEQVLTQCKSST